MTLNASIVVYHTPQSLLDQALRALRDVDGMGSVWVEDNGQGRNLGYGRAHNLALRRSLAAGADYHLVMNADIHTTGADISRCVHYMEQHPEVGLLMPRVLNPDGTVQHLCKLLPTPADLLARRFLPERWTRRRMERFELRRSGYNRVMNIPYLSGCFMLLRCSTLREVGLFDERFFLYPEDLDLCRRIHQRSQTVFYPEVSVIHDHARDSYHSLRLTWVHLTNMARYFNKWGWLIDGERRRVNRETLRTLNLQ